MASGLGFHAKTRDIYIDLDDSCNCCCWGFRNKVPKEDTPVYINSQGKAVKFDFKKAKNEHVALQRSVENLQACLQKIADDNLRGIQSIKEQLEKMVGMKIEADDPPVMTLSTIERINQVLSRILS